MINSKNKDILKPDNYDEEESIFDSEFVCGTERAAAFLLSPREHLGRLKEMRAKKKAEKNARSHAILEAFDDKSPEYEDNIGFYEGGSEAKLKKYCLMAETEARELTDIVLGTKSGLSAQKKIENFVMKLSASLSGGEAMDFIGAAKAAVRTDYMHSLNVGLLAVLICRWSRVLEEDCRGVFLAGLLHDYGRIGNNGDLSKADWVHTADGYKMLSASENKSINIHVRNAALMHHEYRDGTGYPVGLVANDIDVYAQVVALANDFIKLLESGVSPKNAMDNLSERRTRYNGELFGVLQKAVMNSDMSERRGG